MGKIQIKPDKQKYLIKIAQKTSLIALSSCALLHLTNAVTTATPVFTWSVVVNNADTATKSGSETFFSYNAPSINNDGLVVFRARAKMSHGGEENEGENEESNQPETKKPNGNGGGTTQAGQGGSEHESGGHSGNCGMEIGGSPGGAEDNEMIHGIFIRDSTNPGSTIEAIAIRGDKVPEPNNMTGTNAGTFNSFPSFPRIDAESATLAFRAQSKPSYQYTVGEETIKSGTSGLYATPYGAPLMTAIRNIESGSPFTEYLVPGTSTRFEQFPGSPSTTGNFITFKGNWSYPEEESDGAIQASDEEAELTVGMTGIYYRDMTGQYPVYKIAEKGNLIPEDAVPSSYGEENPATFGSTAPPSAAGGKVVFTGLDVESDPKAGGIFMADIKPNPTLKTVASFNTEVPGNSGQKLNAFGEALSFDGRYVGFWAGWGGTFLKNISCPPDGNGALVQDCLEKSENGLGSYTFDVKEHQGIFLADTLAEKIYLVAETGQENGMFDDFLFWNYSGNPEKGEGARWRSSAYFAVDGDNVVFKAEKDGKTGLYGAFDVTSDLFAYDDIFTILETGMDGSLLDPQAKGMWITALGIERDGFRNGRLAIAASMANDEESWAGIYTTNTVPEPGTMALFAIGLGAMGALQRRKPSSK